MWLMQKIKYIFEFIKFLHHSLKFIFNKEVTATTLIMRRPKAFFSWILIYITATITVAFLKYNFQVFWIVITFPQWVLVNVIKDLSMVFLWIFILNYFYIVLRIYQKMAKEEWFDFISNIKSLDQVPPTVLNTWIYKFCYYYMINLNVALIFFSIVMINHIFGFRPSISVVLSVQIVYFCFFIHGIFWADYMYKFYKYRESKKNLNKLNDDKETNEK